MPSEDELNTAVESLLAGEPQLPPPAERARLRQAAGVTQARLARALQSTTQTVKNWENGRSEPRPPRRQAYLRLLAGWAEHHRGPQAAVGIPAHTAATEPGGPPGAGVKAPAAPACGPGGQRAYCHSGPGEPAKKMPARTAFAGPGPAGEERFANGPLVVLDGAGSAYGTGGLVLDCPARDIPSLVEWALAEARLGAPRLHKAGQDADPLLVLTAEAAARFGLPAELADRRSLRLPDDHPVLRQITAAGWQLTRRGFGPWPRVYRPAEGGRRRCVQLGVLPWGALDERTWPGTAYLPPAELAAVLGAYAARVLTPRGSAAVCGLELMTALRPPTRPVRDGAGGWTSGPVPGSLTLPVDPAPPEAPDEHPLVAGSVPRGARRSPDQVLEEEAYEWVRDPQLLTDAECAQPYAIGLDVNLAFAAAANRLTVGLSEPAHLQHPDFDAKTPGAWLADLSHIALDPRLPSPFTPTGQPPAGPAWYATPTVAYAVELGAEVRPLEAYVRTTCGAYLDPWYARLRDAYLATMEHLGVTKDLDEEAFLAAMATHKTADPGQAGVLAAVKATVKGGIGKLRERPQGAGYRPGRPWPALARATWRPDIRAAVISAARTNMHRKMHTLATAAGLFPLAVLSDCVVYPSPGPSPLDLLPRTAGGRPAPGGFRLGVSPGMVKCEGVQSFLWAAELMDAGANPARHIKDGPGAAAEGE